MSSCVAHKMHAICVLELKCMCWSLDWVESACDIGCVLEIELYMYVGRGKLTPLSRVDIRDCWTISSKWSRDLQTLDTMTPNSVSIRICKISPWTVRPNITPDICDMLCCLWDWEELIVLDTWCYLIMSKKIIGKNPLCK